MIEFNSIVELVEQYTLHKWVLRRVLLSELNVDELSDKIRTRYPSAEILTSEIDALWFSRKNKTSETWELRRLGGPPFALVEVIDDTLAADEREAKLAILEAEMAGRKQNLTDEISNGNL